MMSATGSTDPVRGRLQAHLWSTTVHSCELSVVARPATPRMLAYIEVAAACASRHWCRVKPRIRPAQ